MAEPEVHRHHVTHDVAEAVTLADRVLMIEAGEIALDLPRPCKRGSAEVAALEGRVLRHLFRNCRIGRTPEAASSQRILMSAFPHRVG